MKGTKQTKKNRNVHHFKGEEIKYETLIKTTPKSISVFVVSGYFLAGIGVVIDLYIQDDFETNNIFTDFNSQKSGKSEIWRRLISFINYMVLSGSPRYLNHTHIFDFALNFASELFEGQIGIMLSRKSQKSTMAYS